MSITLDAKVLQPGPGDAAPAATEAPAAPVRPVVPQAMEPPRSIPEPQAPGIHPSRQAFQSSTSALDREADRLRRTLRGPVHERPAAGRAALQLCRRYAIRRSRGAHQLSAALLEDVAGSAGGDVAGEAGILARVLAAERDLHELDADRTARALGQLVPLVDDDAGIPAGPDAALALTLTAHALVQLAVHFPETLPALGSTPQAALTRAFGLAETAIAAAPDLADGHSALGRVLTCSDEPEALAAAHGAFERALAIDPEHDPALAGLAALALAEGRPQDALVYADRVLKLGNGSPYAFHLRALALAALDRVEEARRELDRALKLAPDAGQLRVDACILARRAGDGEAAAAHEERARELLGASFDGVYSAAARCHAAAHQQANGSGSGGEPS
jgi:tetratricopeptide (TPR) repeat protein